MQGRERCAWELPGNVLAEMCHNRARERSNTQIL